MAFVEVARFWDVREAQIARSALEASGIPAFLPDEYRAQAIWTEQNAIGGVRLCVNETDSDDVRRFLHAIRNEQAPPSSPVSLQSLSVMTAAGIVSFLFSWPIAAFKGSSAWRKAFAVFWVLSLSAVWIMVWVRRRS